MRKLVKHSGKVVDTHNSYVRVSIISESACASCHAKDVCGAGDQKEKFIDIYDAKEGFTIGEDVEVTLSQRHGRKAVFLAYVMPFVVLMVALMTLLGVGVGEALSALLTISSVALYYLIIYMLRAKIGKSVHFSLRKLT